jgi:hypothetical protein
MGFVGDFIGDITGANDAADAQVNASKDSIAEQRYQFNQMKNLLNPYNQIGMSSIPGLMQSMQPFNADQAASDYLNSGRYAMSEEALNRSLATQSEAAGVGGSAMANAMANALPNLVNQDIARQYGQGMDRFNQNMALVNMGQNSAAMTGNAGMNLASNVSQQLGQMGQAQAMGAMAPFQTLMGGAKLATGFF